MYTKSYLFHFIKYIQPTWYFNLKSSSSPSYWYNYHLLNTDDKALIRYDDAYSSEEASLLDAAYQAWHKGVIVQNAEVALQVPISVSVKDEYRFVKKYYSFFWSVLILIIRLLSFKNPFKEIGGFVANLSTPRENLYQKFNEWKEFDEFDSPLVAQNPLVSIIIPTLNRYEYLDDVIKDLEKQDYQNIELLVCDQSEPFDAGFYENRNINIKLFQQQEKALWQARNTCVKESKGEYLLFFDDDSRVEPDWVRNHLKSIDFFKVKISSGVSISLVGGSVPKNYSFFRWGDQIDTGNVMVHRSVFRTTGLFDRQFEKMRMGDGEFGLRCHINGIANISNPLAKRVHLKVSTGGLRHMGAWDAFRGQNFWAPIPIPSVLYFNRKYFFNKSALYNTFKNLPLSVIPYKYKNNKYLSLMGMLVFVVLLPKYLFQVYKSWKLSSKMLKKGPIIESIC